jgi:hypothetical protein
MVLSAVFGFVSGQLAKIITTQKQAVLAPAVAG